MSLRLLAFAASLRRGSFNRKLLTQAVRIARLAGAEIDLAEFAEFTMPLFDADLQEAQGFPPGAEELARRLRAADGLFIASPEYNYSLPGTLKNAIDWVSRMRPVPFRGKSAFLMATSRGMVGGIRGLWQLRIPLEGNGVVVYPEMFSLGDGGSAFEEDGALRDQQQLKRLEKMVGGYVEVATKLREK